MKRRSLDCIGQVATSDGGVAILYCESMNHLDWPSRCHVV